MPTIESTTDAVEEKESDGQEKNDLLDKENQVPLVGDFSIRKGFEGQFFLEGEYLWWYATLDDLEYAVKSPHNSLAGYFKLPNFRFDPGVRVAFGYHFGPKRWNLVARWTYHCTDPIDCSSIAPNVDDEMMHGIKELYTPGTSTPLKIEVPVDSGWVQWKNRLNVLEIEMGYHHPLDPRLTVQPHFGLKVAWINMNYDIDFGHTDITREFMEPLYVDVFIRNHSDYWGAGPTIGVDATVQLGWGVSLYSKLATALVYGAYNTVLDQSNSKGDHFKIINESEYKQRAMLQLAGGIEWGRYFSSGMLLAFRLGWESQYWWNQNQMRVLINTHPVGDLTLTGIDAAISLDF